MKLTKTHLKQAIQEELVKSFVPRHTQSALLKLDKLAKAALSDVVDSPEAEARLQRIIQTATSILYKLRRHPQRSRWARYAPGTRWWTDMLRKTGRANPHPGIAIYDFPRRKPASGRATTELDTIPGMLNPLDLFAGGPASGAARTLGQRFLKKSAAHAGSTAGATIFESRLEGIIKDILLEDEFRNIALGGKNVRTPEEAGGTTTMMKCDKAGNCKPTSEWETQSGEKVQITHKPSLEDPKARTQGLASFIKYAVAPEFEPITVELVNMFKNGRKAVKRVKDNPMAAATWLFRALYGTSEEEVRPGRAIINILWERFKGKMRELQQYFINLVLKAANAVEKFLDRLGLSEIQLKQIIKEELSDVLIWGDNPPLNLIKE